MTHCLYWLPNPWASVASIMSKMSVGSLESTHNLPLTDTGCIMGISHFACPDVMNMYGGDDQGLTISNCLRPLKCLIGAPWTLSSSDQLKF